MTLAAFYSDPHFGHAKVIEYCKRPFASVDEMNATLITRYNMIVGKHDTCLWLGDCFLCPFDEAADIMRQLNGTKLLVLGNHDRSAASMARIGFTVVANSMTLHIAGKIVRAHHLPYAGTPQHGHEDARSPDVPAPKRARGEVLLHGHTHDKEHWRPGMVHCGVDAWDYAPASYGAVAALIEMAAMTRTQKGSHRCPAGRRCSWCGPLASATARAARQEPLPHTPKFSCACDDDMGCPACCDACESATGGVRRKHYTEGREPCGPER